MRVLCMLPLDHRRARRLIHERKTRYILFFQQLSSLSLVYVWVNLEHNYDCALFFLTASYKGAFALLLFVVCVARLKCPLLWRESFSRFPNEMDIREGGQGSNQDAEKQHF